jgi:tRNA dimethylallyltransferase
MSVRKPKIVVIVGPTASGKSDLAVKIARKFNGEIVSADSRQVYRSMDIGTAKYRTMRQYMIDIKNPDEDYTVAEYKKDALAAIRKILKRGKLPILAGGTGLYVKAVVDNLDIPAVAADEKLRRRLEEKAKKRGLDYLFKKLVKLDPETAYIVDPKNPRRVIRALEIAIKTGRPFSTQRKVGRRLFNTLQIGIRISPEKLKARIGSRVDRMIKNGLIKEVKKLVKKYGWNQKALRRGSAQAFDAIGYREIIAYFKKQISLDEAVRLIKRNTWHYAKRQMTWFKKDKNIKWLKGCKGAEELVRKFLSENHGTVPPKRQIGTPYGKIIVKVA